MGTLKIRVIPNASKDQLCGWLENTLKVKVHAPPEDGKANQKVLKLLAANLAVQERALSVKSGATARNKLIDVQGLDDAEIRRRLTTQPKR